MNAKEIEAAILSGIKDNKGVRREFDNVVDDVHDTLVDLSPVETGRYRTAHEKTKLPDVKGLPAARISNDDEAAPFIEYGTEDTEEFGVYRKTVALYS